MTSRHPERARRRDAGHRPRGDEGFTLVAAVAVAAVAILIATTVVTVAVRTESSAGRDRSRTQALAAAEAGLDAAVLRVKGLTPAQRLSASGCAPTTSTVWSSPGTSTVTVTHAFTTAAGTACPAPAGAAVTGAVLRSTATHTAGTSTATRRMTATVSLGDPALPASKYAIFADRELVGGVSSHIATADGDVYVRTGDYTCGTSAVVGGATITVRRGAAVLGTSCDVQGSIQASDGVVVGTSARVRGDVSTWGGGVRLETSARVDGAVTASGTVTRGTSATIAGPVTQNSPAAPPPEVGMPRITHRPDDWRAYGFSPAVWSAPCSLATSQTVTITTRSVFDARGACGSAGFRMGTSSVLRVSADVAVFANSFTAGTSATIQSADGLPHRVWFIVPAAETGDYCQSPSGDIALGTSVAATAPIALFLYSPCDVSVATSAAWNGQVWGGRLQLSTSSSTTYQSVGVPGVPVPGQAAEPLPVTAVVKTEVAPS